MAGEGTATRGSSFRSGVLTLVVIALMGVVAWLLSERNARHWYLVYDGGTLSVKKGIMFPVGRQAFKTDDPALAQAYAPLTPPPSAKLDEERSFDDRAGLDQALYDLLARWAREDVATQRPEMVERALSWLARADRLAGISAAQREDLRALRAESGYFEARQLLEKGAEALRQARERLRLTAGSSSPHAGDAGEALHRIDPVVDELYRAMRVLAPGGARPAETAPGTAPPSAPGSTSGATPVPDGATR